MSADTTGVRCRLCGDTKLPEGNAAPRIRIALAVLSAAIVAVLIARLATDAGVLP